VIEVPIPTGLNLHDFQNFRRMLTPELIKIVYVVGLGLTVIMSLVLIGASFIAGGALGAAYFFGGVILLITGFLWLRLFCESIIVVFKILDELVAINQKLAPTEPNKRTA
jgi:hypothetical protein